MPLLIFSYLIVICNVDFNMSINVIECRIAKSDNLSNTSSGG